MLKIRKNSFETNSSSVHALVIREDSWFDEPEHMIDEKKYEIKGDYYGRAPQIAFDSTERKLNYIWTMVIGLFGKHYVDWETKTIDYVNKERFDKWCDMIYAICPKANLIEPAVDDWNIGIDHVYKLEEFANIIEDDPSLLRQFILSYSWIEVFGDEYPCWVYLFQLPHEELIDLNYGNYIYVKGN